MNEHVHAVEDERTNELELVERVPLLEHACQVRSLDGHLSFCELSALGIVFGAHRRGYLQ